MTAFRLPTPPSTIEGWRIVAQAAAALLAIDSARDAGLLSGGPSIDREHCLDLIACAAEHGVTPVEHEVIDAIEQIAIGFTGEAVDLDG